MKTQHSRANSFSLQRKTRNVRRKKENNAKVRYLSIHILFERKKIALSILFNTTGYIYIYIFSSGILRGFDRHRKSAAVAPRPTRIAVQSSF